MDKILITGGSGLLGSNLSKAALSKFEVYAVFHSNEVTGRDIMFLQADLTDHGDLERLELIQPDAIVHCAALTDVDFCEKHPAEANQQNCLASAHVAKLALYAKMSAQTSKTVKVKEQDLSNTVAIIQARMGSTRLPGKVMMEVAGHPLRWHVIDRVRGSRLAKNIVVPTAVMTLSTSS